MDILEALNERHSVRQFKDIPIEAEKVEKLKGLIAAAN